MSVKRIQKEETYFVTHYGHEYIVTVISDLENLYIQYDVFDEDGEEIISRKTILELAEKIESFTE